MLWYKAWLETRSRFLISLIGMVALCSVLVFHGDRNVTYEVELGLLQLRALCRPPDTGDDVDSGCHFDNDGWPPA